MTRHYHIYALSLRMKSPLMMISSKLHTSCGLTLFAIKESVIWLKWIPEYVRKNKTKKLYYLTIKSSTNNRPTCVGQYLTMKKHPEQTAITKQNIKNAFWDEFKNKTIDKITVKEICSITGYNRSTFYQYFRDVYDVLETIENELIEELDRLFDENPIELIASNGFISKVTEIYNSKGELLYYLLNNQTSNSFSDKYKTLIKSKLFTTEIDDDEKRIKISILLEFMVSAVISALSFWYPRRDKMDTSEFIEYIQSIATSGPINIIKELI